VLIKLLDRAAETMDSDRAAAKDCITRASALLQAAANDRVRLARGGLAPWQVRQVTRHIDGALESTIRTHDCAKITRLSTCYFSRAFKVSFGETFCQYIAGRRTERAQEMMMMTDEPLSQIAISCGFADQSHFSRVYRRQVGSSPAAWRRQRGREPLMRAARFS
jgi:AraC-like DNA-binding protein